MMIDVVTFGETMAAIRAPGPLRQGGLMRLSMAGAESNVAIGLVRLGHTVRWVGRVGADELGELVLRTLRAEGVDLAYARSVVGRPTGLLLRERLVDDVARVHYYRSGSAGSTISALDVALALDGDMRLVHVTGVTPALGPAAAGAVQLAVERARMLGATVSFDVNYRAKLWSTDAAQVVLGPLAAAADIVFASADELSLVSDTPMSLLGQGVAEVVVKRGADGAEVHTGSAVVRVPAREVRTVDVVGAGDAFVAGYLSAFLDGADVPTRLRRATITSAFAVAHEGDWEGLPARDELDLLDRPRGTTLR